MADIYFKPYQTVLQGIAYALAAEMNKEDAEQWFEVESRSKLEKFILEQRKNMDERRFYFIAGGQLMCFWSELHHQDAEGAEILSPIIGMVETLIFSNEK